MIDKTTKPSSRNLFRELTDRELHELYIRFQNANGAYYRMNLTLSGYDAKAEIVGLLCDVWKEIQFRHFVSTANGV